MTVEDIIQKWFDEHSEPITDYNPNGADAYYKGFKSDEVFDKLKILAEMLDKEDNHE